MKTIIVAGCTRSGLTLMMQLLHTGGYPCFGTWPAFENYELGCIPFSKVNGKAIKLVDSHLQFPPQGDYYIIRLRRDLKQQAKSIIKFMRLIGLPASNKHIPQIIDSTKRDYLKIDKWAKTQSGMIIVDFEDMINKPKEVLKRISEFIGYGLKEAAISCVIERNTDCYPGMFETKLEFFDTKQ